MASLTRGVDNIDWLWGSLRPWQILHSTLAERERYGNVLDVWELVNETLNATTITKGHEGDGGRSQGMQFLADIIDGDFWRHGGVMESRVKECLNALNQQEEEAAEELVASHHRHSDQHSVHTCHRELALARSTQLPCTPRSIAWESAAAGDADAQHHYKIGEERDESEAAMAPTSTGEEEQIEEEEEEEEVEPTHGCLEVDEEGGKEEEEDGEDSRCVPIARTSREANYSLMNANYNDSPNYREISTDRISTFVLNTCRSAVAGAACDDQAVAVWRETANLAEGTAAPPYWEDNVEVCAVCLEKLTHCYEESVQALACRHAFHTVCIAPWLQREPHACCPCCRAPIFAANLAPPLHLPTNSDLATDHNEALHDDRYVCAGLQEVLHQPVAGNDIMRLLADVEAALEHLGFRC